MNIAAIIWLILMVVFLMMEAATVSLVSTWFAGGALAAMLVSLLGGPIWLQALVFFTVSIVLLILLRPMVRKYIKPKIVATNAESMVGKTCLVVEQINNLTASGRVKLGDVTWSARSETGEVIPEGTQVRILKLQGVKVFVEKQKEETEEKE